MAGFRKRPRIDKKNLILRRLSAYLRTLDHLDRKGEKFVSSQGLEKIEGVSQSLVRRDLAEFGTFGTRGVGYAVPRLREQIHDILIGNRIWRIVVIGAGGLSNVFLHSATFQKRNLVIAQIFDSDPHQMGASIQGITIRDMANLETELDAGHIDLAIIAVPPPQTQHIIDRLHKLGIRGALYFASRPVEIPEGMAVLNMDITIELGVLTYHLQQNNDNT